MCRLEQVGGAGDERARNYRAGCVRVRAYPEGACSASRRPRRGGPAGRAPWYPDLTRGPGADPRLRARREATLTDARPGRRSRSAELAQNRLLVPWLVPAMTVHQAKGREWDTVGGTLQPHYVLPPGEDPLRAASGVSSNGACSAAARQVSAATALRAHRGAVTVGGGAVPGALGARLLVGAGPLRRRRHRRRGLGDHLLRPPARGRCCSTPSARYGNGSGEASGGAAPIPLPDHGLNRRVFCQCGHRVGVGTPSSGRDPWRGGTCARSRPSRGDSGTDRELQAARCAQSGLWTTSRSRGTQGTAQRCPFHFGLSRNVSPLAWTP
jgi:hypothetical protein